VPTGAQLGQLVGVPPGDVVGFSFRSNAWVQIPVQVDERVAANVGQIYNGAAQGTLNLLCYADPNTFTGPDTNALFDADDEVALMLGDGGAAATGAGHPPGVVTNSGVELALADPLVPGSSGYVYLFRRLGTLDPSAGRTNVVYNFNLLSGNYKTTYKLSSGPNPENSTVSNAFCYYHFSDRWVDDDLKILQGGNGLDLLDRHKSMVVPNNCFRSEDTFSGAEGAFIVNKSGPVRGIRSFMGANSGPFTQRDHFFYQRRQDITIFHRVHEIGSSLDFYDYNNNAIGMTNFNNLNPGGLKMDGVPDVAVRGALQWELVTGTQGSLVMLHRGTSNIPTLQITNYCNDILNQSFCTGDANEIGASGPWAVGIQCTDPNLTGGGCDTNFLTIHRTLYFFGASSNVTLATQLNTRLSTPVTVQVSAWPGAALTPPAAPSGLVATGAPPGQVNVSWQDNSTNESGFHLERRVSVVGTWGALAEVGSNVVSYADTNVVAGGRYDYQVRAWNGAGSSAYSAPATGTAPGAPARPSIAVVSNAPISFQFGITPGRTSLVEYAESLPAPQWIQLQSVLGNATPATVTDTNTPTGQRYYRVRLQ